MLVTTQGEQENPIRRSPHHLPYRHPDAVRRGSCGREPAAQPVPLWLTACERSRQNGRNLAARFPNDNRL